MRKVTLAVCWMLLMASVLLLISSTYCFLYEWNVPTFALMVAAWCGIAGAGLGFYGNR